MLNTEPLPVRARLPDGEAGGSGPAECDGGVEFHSQSSALMHDSPRSEALHIGFLTVLELPGGAFVGGLLVTNRLGRPLEFQCTTPVKPNRTQEILYGPTLRPFLYSELIGKTLWERLQVRPHLLVVDQAELLELRPHAGRPVACLVDPARDASDLPDQTHIALGQRRVRCHPEHPEDVDQVKEQSRLVPLDADLAEPVDRVRQALAETLRGAA